MPRTSILSLVLLPLVIAATVFAWTPGIVVRAAGNALDSSPEGQAKGVDLKAVESVIDDFYRLRAEPGRAAQGTGKPGIPTLFHPGFGRGSQGFVSQDQSSQNFEREFTRRVERRGNLAHVWSTFGRADGAAGQESVPHGLRSFQLILDERRWWILSVCETRN